MTTKTKMTAMKIDDDDDDDDNDDNEDDADADGDNHDRPDRSAIDDTTGLPYRHAKSPHTNVGDPKQLTASPTNV